MNKPMTDAAKQPKDNDYTQTLFLPETDFPMRAGLPVKEPEILKRWEEIDLYKKLRAQSASKKARHVLHDGPPYANGHIHIGTALNKILKDIVVRSTQMAGYDCAYVPGWDCHGLPIEWKIEEQYRAAGKKKPDLTNADALIAFRNECRRYAEKWLSVQREEFKRLGGTGDWAHPYATMDFKAEAAIANELLKFANTGQLYRGSKPVMWAVAEGTALAEAEVEYQDVTSDQIWVKFLISDQQTDLKNASVVIWTTTPWTIPGNRAISFSHKISYGLYEVIDAPEDNWIKKSEKFILADKLAENVLKQARVGNYRLIRRVGADELALLICQHPLSSSSGLSRGSENMDARNKSGHDGFYNFSIPLLDGDHVTDDTGTGFVHTAPSHGRDDFEIWMNNKSALEARGIDTHIPYTVDEHSFYTKDAPGFKGKRVLKEDGSKGDANDAMIEALKNANMLVARGKLKHSYPHSWRSKTPVIFRNTPQWFIAMDKTLDDNSTLRSRALKSIAETEWHPPIAQNRITGMVKDRPDWVMSRQRAWGVPITVFVKKDSGEILQDDAVNARIIAAFEKEGADAWFQPGAAKRFWPEFDENEWQMVSDVLDVWFDSGCTHVITLDARDELAVERKPAGKDKVIYFEGSDQHRGWFQSSLLKSCGTRGRAPYDTVITHGFVVDSKGEKMSKSKGNTVAPQDIIKQSGADILRLWVASSDYSEDLRIGPEILKTVSDTYRKIRNTLRWMLGTLAHDNKDECVPYEHMPELEKYVLSRLYKTGAVIETSYKNYDFRDVVTYIQNFMSNDLSSFYFDVRKDTLYCEPLSSPARKASLSAINEIFHAVTTWLAPVLSFTAEEAWLSRDPSKASVHLEDFYQVPKVWNNDALEEKWDSILHLRSVVTGCLEIERVNKVIGASLEAAPVVYVTNEKIAEAIKGVDLAEICITSGLTVRHETPPQGAFALPHVEGVGVVFKKAEGIKCARSWRITNDVGSDPDYPDVSARDAKALREWHAQRATA